MSSKPEIKPAIAPNPAAPAEAPPPPPHDAMRRLQIGIAGVLTVLLLVGMAGLIGDRARERAAADPDTAAEVKVPGADQKPASAPLEELGTAKWYAPRMSPAWAEPLYCWENCPLV